MTFVGAGVVTLFLTKTFVRGLGPNARGYCGWNVKSKSKRRTTDIRRLHLACLSERMTFLWLLFGESGASDIVPFVCADGLRLPISSRFDDGKSGVFVCG